MILAFDLLAEGVHHAAFNSAMLQTLALALPGQTVRVHGDASHIAELRRDAVLTGNLAIEFHDVAIPQQFKTKSQVVSVRRFIREFVTIRRALRTARGSEACLLVLLNATSTAIYAASLLARLRRRETGVLVCLHGNLEVLPGWRSRNPIVRAFDLHSMLNSRSPVPLGYLVLEESIKAELGKIAPRALAAVEVLPFPADLSVIDVLPVLDLRRPIRVGLIGQATEAKGISPFLETARVLKREFGEQIEFHLIGRTFPGGDAARFSVLDSPVSPDRLSREQFRDQIGRIHFALLPLQPSYYRLAASGALLDAITWLKPVIATPLPIVTDMFAQFGEIGYVCDTTDGMRDALRLVLTEMDEARYTRQLGALRHAREARLPAALAERLRGILRGFFPGILARETH
jgi:hypothetical protein